MDRYGFYEEFIKGNQIRLKELFNELHTAYDIRNSLYKDVEQHKDLLRVLNINFDTLTCMLTVDKYHKVHISKQSKKLLPPELIKTIEVFSYICNTKLAKLKHEIKIVRLLTETPNDLYFSMQYWFNREVGNTILRGDVYNFGQGLSRLGISYVERSPNAKPVVDWGESNKLKKTLIEAGHTVKSVDNPTGIKWLLYRTDAGYSFWKWLKREAFTPNKKMYKFRAIATNNECTEYEGKLSQEQILDKSIGTFDKMMALLKLNPLMIHKYDF